MSAAAARAGWRQRHGRTVWRLLLAGALLLALALDIAGHVGHLAFVLPCSLFALGLIAAQWRRAAAPAAPALPWHGQSRLSLSPDMLGHNTELPTPASVVFEGETLVMPPPATPLPGMMAVLDLQHQCLAASPALARWLDMDRDQMAGQRIEVLFGDEAAELLTLNVAAALGGSLRRLRCTHVHPEGHRRWLQVELQPRLDEFGQPIGCDLLAMDVTPEQRRLDALQRRDRRMRKLMNRLPVAVTYANAEGLCRYANQAEADWLGLRLTDLVGRPLSALLGADEWARLGPDFQAALRGEQRELSRVRIDASGQPEHQAGLHLPDRLEDGRIAGVYTVYVDARDRARLRQQLRLRDEELRQLRRLLPRQAAGDVTPAGALPGTPAETGATTGPDAPGAAVAEALRPLDHGPTDAAAPSATAATAAAATGPGPTSPGATAPAGPTTPADTPPAEAPPAVLGLEALDFELAALVEDALQGLAPRAHARQLQIACRIDSRLPAGVRGDPQRLRQVLATLIDHAVRTTPSGEVLVDVQRPDAHTLRFAVIDTGMGLDADACARVFTPPMADDDLAGAQRLVQWMGGQIGVDSSPGQGSSFWFALPLVTADSIPAVPPPSALARRHVLVVDDHASQREIAELHLEAAGMRVGLAANGAEALSMLQRAQAQGDGYELALIDMKMPGMDGLALVSQIRALPALASVRLVLVASHQSPGELARARQAGLTVHLGKPLRRRELYLGLCQAITDQPSPAPSASSVAGPALPIVHARVLLAEDSGVNQVVTQYMLEALGCEFEIVGNGVLALEAIKRDHFDLLLLDCDMPVLDGPAVANEVRAREEEGGSRRRLPMVGLTAEDHLDEAEACTHAGMDDHLPKPYSRQQLAEMLMRWLPPELVEQPGGGAPGASLQESPRLVA